MSVKLRTRKSREGLIYYLDIHDRGKRIRETLKIDFSLTEKKRRDLAEVEAGEARKAIMSHGPAPAFRTRNFIAIFEQHVNSLPKGNNRKYAGTLSNLKEYFGSTLLTSHITAEKLTGWKKHLIKKYHGETPLTRWKCMKVVMNRCIRDGLVRPIQITGVAGPPVPETISKSILTSDELRCMAVAMNDEYVCRAFLWCCFTGMGRADLLLMKWEKIDFSRKQIEYMRAKTGQWVVVEVSDFTLSLLPERNESLVWTRLPSDSYIHRTLNAWSKGAGVNKKLSFYCGRHTFAVLLLSAGVDLRTVSKMMGHTTTKQTEKYLKYADMLKRDAADRLPVLNMQQSISERDPL